MRPRTSHGLALGAGGLGTIGTVMVVATSRGRRLARQVGQHTRAGIHQLALRVQDSRDRPSDRDPSPDPIDAVSGQPQPLDGRPA